MANIVTVKSMAGRKLFKFVLICFLFISKATIRLWNNFYQPVQKNIWHNLVWATLTSQTGPFVGHMLLASRGNREVRECVFISNNCDQWWHFSSPLKHSCERIYRRNNSYRQPEILWFPRKCQVDFPSGGVNFTRVCYYDLRPWDIGVKAENHQKWCSRLQTPATFYWSIFFSPSPW